MNIIMKRQYDKREKENIEHFSYVMNCNFEDTYLNFSENKYLCLSDYIINQIMS